MYFVARFITFIFNASIDPPISRKNSTMKCKFRFVPKTINAIEIYYNYIKQTDPDEP